MRVARLSGLLGAPLILGACATAIPASYTDRDAGAAYITSQTSGAIGKRTACAQTRAENEA